MELLKRNKEHEKVDFDCVILDKNKFYFFKFDSNKRIKKHIISLVNQAVLKKAWLDTYNKLLYNCGLCLYFCGNIGNNGYYYKIIDLNKLESE